MKNGIVKISVITATCIVISATALVSSQSNQSVRFSPEPNLSLPTPTPTRDREKVCRPSATPTPAVSPTPEVTPVVNELSLNDVNAILKRMDSDCDGISDYADNCVFVSNPDQRDRNKNKIGDACEPKITSPKQKNGCDMPNSNRSSAKQPESELQNNSGLRAEYLLISSMRLDWDCDEVSDHDDNCRNIFNPSQKDRNKNGVGDACEVKKRRPKKSTRKK